MVGLGHLLVDVSAEFVQDARYFYAVRPAGRGPRTAEELSAARSAGLHQPRRILLQMSV